MKVLKKLTLFWKSSGLEITAPAPAAAITAVASGLIFDFIVFSILPLKVSTTFVAIFWPKFFCDNVTICALKLTSEDGCGSCGIGDTAESNGVKVTLVNAETGHGSQYLTPSAGNIFVTLEFEIENDSSSDINVSSIASLEAYCDDYSVTESITAVTLSDKSTLDGNVAAGKKMKGVISYEVPEDWQNLEVTFSPSFWSNHSVTFEVKSNWFGSFERFSVLI